MEVTYSQLISALTQFTNVFSNPSGYTTTPVTINLLGQSTTIERIQGFLIPILPQLFIFIGVVIAIRVILRLFKKFSR